MRSALLTLALTAILMGCAGPRGEPDPVRSFHAADFACRTDPGVRMAYGAGAPGSYYAQHTQTRHPGFYHPHHPYAHHPDPSVRAWHAHHLAHHSVHHHSHMRAQQRAYERCMRSRGFVFR